MTTALATTSNQTRALARFGSEEEIKLLMTRQAAIFGVPQADINRPDVQASLIKATQYSITYGYLPGIHIHMIPFRKNDKQGGRDNWIDTYVPDLGEKAWKDSADRLSQMQGFKYLVETKEMTQAEIKAATAADPTSEYSEDDAGFKARVLRSDHAEIYKMMGQAYNPEWSYGFWRKKAKKKSNGEWLSDTVPTQRSPRDVAERRATKAALMKVFTLIPLNDFEDSRRFRSLATYVETETAVDMTLMAQPQATHYDEDGLLMWGEATDGQYRTVDTDTGEVQFMQAPPVTPVTTNGNGHKTTEAPADDVAGWAANPDAVLINGYTFKNPAEAKGWGMAMGVFRDDKHADNAYNEVKREHSPKTPDEMWNAWINDVARRVNEKLAEPVTA